MKMAVKIMGGLSAVWVFTMLAYWFNMDNKMIYYVVRPLLNKWYDSQERDVKM